MDRGQAVWVGTGQYGRGPGGVDGVQVLCPDTRAGFVPDPTGWWLQ